AGPHHIRGLPAQGMADPHDPRRARGVRQRTGGRRARRTLLETTGCFASRRRIALAGSRRRVTQTPPLDGIRVLDLATLFAGPLVATFLGDFGANVVKVEHPRGDPVRGHGHSKNGAGLWAKMINRNKRMLTLDLSRAEAQQILRELARSADVLVEN